MLNEQELQAFKTAKEVVSSETNYHRYRSEQRKADQVPCIPLLGEQYDTDIEPTAYLFIAHKSI